MNIEDIYPYFYADCPGVPDAIARVAVILTLRDFFERTSAWVETQDAAPLIEGIADYDIDPPRYAKTANILEVKVNGLPLMARTTDQLDDEMPGWEAAEGVPIYYNGMVEQGAIRMFPKPKNIGTSTFTVRATYVPTLAATTIPDALFENHTEALLHGIKARLMAQPDQKWSKPGSVAFHGSLYEGSVDRANIKARHQNVRGNLSVKPVSFGGRR